MIKRYSYPQMRTIWEPESKFQKWLEVEVLVCEALSEMGQIPKPAAQKIKQKAKFEINRIEELERETQHDFIAFLRAVGENLDEEAKYLHLGLTSYDVEDTALCLLLRDSANLILQDIQELIQVLKKRAQEHKYTIMIGRTHGVHAEPTTFGLKLAGWITELQRNLKRLEEAKENISYGKISGAVGTYANIDPGVEKYVCAKLGLKPAEVSTQILQRDRHAQYLLTLAIIASSLDKFATEIRNLQRTDLLEVEEAFKLGQRGSSAMPHKRNPIICERVSGLARVVRANSIAALENIPLWHERDITHSSVERVIFPDSNILVDYMLCKFKDVMANLVVYPENMRHNLERTGGLIASEQVMLALVEHGLAKDDAYKLIQRNAMAAWENHRNFKELLLEDNEVMKYLNPQELDKCFDYNYHLKWVDQIFQRVGI